MGHARENAALFQASFLRLKAWAAGEGPRAEYRDRYNKPVPYTAEYARAWGVLSQLYKQPDQLFRAIETTGYMALNQSQHPYLRHSIDTGEETVLAAALESLRVRLPPSLLSPLPSPCRGLALSLAVLSLTAGCAAAGRDGSAQRDGRGEGRSLSLPELSGAHELGGAG